MSFVSSIGAVAALPAPAGGARVDRAGSAASPRPAPAPAPARTALSALPVRAPLRDGGDTGPAAAAWLAHRLVEGTRSGPGVPHERGVAAYPSLSPSLELFAPGQAVALPAGTARPIVVRVA